MRAKPCLLRGCWLGLLVTTGLAASGPCLAKTLFSDSVIVTQAIDDDLYAAAGNVQLDAAIAGAALVAAGTAAISGDVAGDVLLLGGQIDLNGGVGDDLRAAGGNVQVTGFVTDQAAITGGTVSLGPESAIGGQTWIAAGTAELAGQIGSDLPVYTRANQTNSTFDSHKVDTRIRMLAGLQARAGLRTSFLHSQPARLDRLTY